MQCFILSRRALLKLNVRYNIVIKLLTYLIYEAMRRLGLGREADALQAVLLLSDPVIFSARGITRASLDSDLSALDFRSSSESARA